MMTDEIKEETKEEEVTPTYLEQVKAEREAMEKVRDDLKELRAVEVMSGKADLTQPPEKPVEETPEEYAQRALKGQL